MIQFFNWTMESTNNYNKKKEQECDKPQDLEVIGHRKMLKLAQELVSSVIKSCSDIHKLNDVARKVIISNDRWEPNFSREHICLSSLYPSIMGVIKEKCSSVFLDVKVFTKLLFFGSNDTVYTTNLKSVTVEEN